MDRRTVSIAFKDWLASATGKHVELMVAPLRADNMTDDLYYPYAIVYPLPGMSDTITLSNARPVADVPYQVTCVGQDYQQTEWLADRVRNNILDMLPYAFLSVGNAIVTSTDTKGGPSIPALGEKRDICSISERFDISVSLV